jgi:invasion protein IalB
MLGLSKGGGGWVRLTRRLAKEQKQQQPANTVTNWAAAWNTICKLVAYKNVCCNQGPATSTELLEERKRKERAMGISLALL